MTTESGQRRRSSGKPVAAFRTSWQMLTLLDSLVELEGSSRGRVINAALMQYAEDYLGARSRMSPDFLRNKLRRIDLLQRRIEAGLQQGKDGSPEELQENRRDLLHEACRYALYSANPDSCKLLSRTATWLTYTCANTCPPETQTRELKAMLQAMIDRHTAEANRLNKRKGAKQAAL